MLFRRPLHRRHGMPAVMTDQVHHARAIEIAPLAVGGIVRASREETNQKRQHFHFTLTATISSLDTPYIATPLPCGNRPESAK
jgi:hypothetical protein